MSLASRFLRSKKRDLYVKKKYVLMSLCLKDKFKRYVILQPRYVADVARHV